MMPRVERVSFVWEGRGATLAEQPDGAMPGGTWDEILGEPSSMSIDIRSRI